MASIYIHIPFCKTRCIYCGFFSTTQTEMTEQYVAAVIDELGARRIDERIDTIYFGGGTPSQLQPQQLQRLLLYIYKVYDVADDAEVTMEGNPDDLTPTYLETLRSIGINRLSMGVQSFDDARLRFIRRRHSAEQAIEAVRNAQSTGFANISIDLMFGFPGQSLQQWQADVQRAIDLNVQHISAYSLMYEEDTLLGRMLERGEVEEISDELSSQMYEYLCDALGEAGYEHYEISNFAKPGYRSRHNSGYWNGTVYIGVGAGAHSYDGTRRSSNPCDVRAYVETADKLSMAEVEELTDTERYDEYVFTGLRTIDGLDMGELERKFGTAMRQYCMSNAEPHLRTGRLVSDGDVIRLTRQGLFVSNDIMSDLMWVE